MRVGIIGVGRVGVPLGVALARAGHRITAVHAVSRRSRQRAEQHFPGVPLLPVAEVVTGADLVVLTVPDDALGPLVAGLAEVHAVRPGQLFLHASGRHGIAVLAPAIRSGAAGLALHPVMTFTGSVNDLDRLAGCPFGVTSSPALRPVAEALVMEMGGEPFWIAEEARPLYHAALANGANHLVTLVAATLDLLRAAGVPDPVPLIGPLLGAALANVLRLGDLALTGPVVRGDAGTVQAHLAELERVAPQTRDAYLAMARLTADRALAAGLLDPREAEGLLAVLGRQPPR